MEDRNLLLQSFLETWPVSRVQNLTLQEYSNLNKKDSFCYWLEAVTYHLGSIWGGSAFKFGIYEKNQKETIFSSSGRLSDGEYAWMKKYGETREEAFEKVKNIILSIISAVKNDNYSVIDSIDLGDAVKWKIAFLYSDNQILNIFNKIKLLKIAEVLSLSVDKKISFSELQKTVLNSKPEDQDFFNYSSKIWDLDKENNQKKYWLYSPGEQAVRWNEFYEDGIIAIGWDLLGDLSIYKNKNEIQQKLIEVYESDTNRNNDATANYDFANTINIGDIIIVKKGRKQLLGYGEVVSDYYFDDERDDFFHCRNVDWKSKGNWHTDHMMVMKSLTDITTYDSEIDPTKKYYLTLMEKMTGILSEKNEKIDNYINLIQYKKQIILQGPPGTGKTRLAKEIALEMIGNTGGIDLKQYLIKGISISNASGAEDYYFLENVSANSVELSSERATKKWSASFNKIQEKLSQLQRGESPKNKGGDDPYVLAVAKYVFQKFKDSSDTVENNDQVKLVQFHPSYTYEDFVRGIVAKPSEDGNGILYEAENKILGDFANTASINYNESLNTATVDVVSNFTRFIDYIIEEIDQKEKFMISDTIYIFYVDEKRFKYKGDSWTTHSKGLNMNFSELQKIITLELNSRKDINKSEKLNALTRQHATYYQNFVELYKNFVSQNPPEIKERILKNYVLIIDEINRANLSSVLGELIYALEYRGEKVESMYEVDGTQKLILPPNLFIIGTMNTADRSVGHIDYAIRRRFAFVDVLPENLKETHGLESFSDELFLKVAKLFDTNLSQEFKKSDVQLGHSYFIDKSDEGGSMPIRFEYEIKPILLEYVKDGILIGKVGEVEIETYINSLMENN